MFIIKILFLCLLSITSAEVFDKRLDGIVCPDIPENILEYLLGAAYNPRYMSIDQPNSDNDGLSSIKRSSSGHFDDFYVDESFYDVVDDRPAWEVDNFISSDRLSVRSKRDMENNTFSNKNHNIIIDSRNKRGVDDHQAEWKCRSRIVWTDLGPDYFPRYLRSVKCLSEKCWYNLYKCKPKSFTVKLLRRRKGRCVKATKEQKIGTVGLPEEFKQLWVWEERAVNFCCDCTIS